MAPIVAARLSAHRRLASLRYDAVTAKPSDLDRLPTELKLDILETAISTSCSSISWLLLVSKALTQLVEHILYRTVRLPTHASIRLFQRTIRTRPPSFVEATVKELIVTCPLTDASTCLQLQEIASMCLGIRKLVVPSTRAPMGFLDGLLLACSRTPLRELCLETYHDDTLWAREVPAHQNVNENTCAALTHLRVCQPSDAWYRPTHILDHIGLLPRLTHLFLSRRANANENNDVVFAEDIRMILRHRPKLERLVVGIFSPASSLPRQAKEEEDFNIVQLLHPITCEDERLVIQCIPQGPWTAQCNW